MGFFALGLGARALAGFGFLNQVARTELKSVGGGVGHVFRSGITFLAHINYTNSIENCHERPEHTWPSRPATSALASSWVAI